jgi:hypothetical protein
MSDKKTNLFKALSKFIEAMRLYLYTGLNNQYGAAWERKYFESLHHSKTEHWGMRLQEGIDPIQLIDYGNLKDFAIQNKNFFEKDFGSQKNALPTFFGQISEARNMINHYGIYINDKAEKAYLHMIEIAQKLEMNELENDLRKLKDNSFNHYVIPTKSTKSTKTTSSDNRLKKPDAIKLINNSLDYDKLSNANTVYSNQEFYSSSRLTFKRDIIESLDEDGQFSVHVLPSNEVFTFTKKEFYQVFDNVIASKSYMVNGIYNYSRTPQKAYEFLSKS